MNVMSTSGPEQRSTLGGGGEGGGHKNMRGYS